MRRRSEFKQPFVSTNEEKNETSPVVLYTVHQHVEEANQMLTKTYREPYGLPETV